MFLLTFWTSLSHRRVFPPASRQNPSFLYLKSLLCLVLMTTALTSMVCAWFRQWVIQKPKRASLVPIQSISEGTCLHRAQRILKENSHPSQSVHPAAIWEKETHTLIFYFKASVLKRTIHLLYIISIVLWINNLFFLESTSNYTHC